MNLGFLRKLHLPDDTTLVVRVNSEPYEALCRPKPICVRSERGVWIEDPKGAPVLAFEVWLRRSE